MKVIRNGRTFYIRDSSLYGGTYMVNIGEFQPELFRSTCQGETGRQQCMDWIDKNYHM